ncbi:MAG: hypothetical protein WAV28_19540 [Sedimentisphaerales bacterium]
MNIAMEQKDWSAVLENGNKYLSVYPMLGTIYWCMGRANEELGQDDQAVELYRRLLLLEPADPADVNYRLARLFAERDPVTAKRYVLEALADAPRFRQAHRLLLKLISDGPAPAPIEPRPSDGRGEPVPQSGSTAGPGSKSDSFNEGQLVQRQEDVP